MIDRKCTCQNISLSKLTNKLQTVKLVMTVHWYSNSKVISAGFVYLSGAQLWYVILWLIWGCSPNLVFCDILFI